MEWSASGMRNNVATEQRRVVGSSIKSRLCVNRSPIKYGFLAGLRAIQHSMIIAQVSCLTITLFTAIFVWPWNENARTKQKQPTNANRAIWLVYGTDTNERGFWLVKQTIRWKNFMPENFLEINRFFALTSYCNTIGQANNTLSILGFSLAGKRRVHVLIFSSIGW